jgi:hypothetical protein
MRSLSIASPSDTAVSVWVGPLVVRPDLRHHCLVAWGFSGVSCRQGLPGTRRAQHRPGLDRPLPSATKMNQTNAMKSVSSAAPEIDAFSPARSALSRTASASRGVLAGGYGTSRVRKDRRLSFPPTGRRPRRWAERDGMGCHAQRLDGSSPAPTQRDCERRPMQPEATRFRHYSPTSSNLNRFPLM